MKCFRHVGAKVSNRDDAAMLWPIARREAPHLAASASLPNLQRRHSVASTTTAPSSIMPSPRWRPGESGNPDGRTRGSRNKLSEEVICALLRDFRQHGQKAVA